MPFQSRAVTLPAGVTRRQPVSGPPRRGATRHPASRERTLDVDARLCLGPRRGDAVGPPPPSGLGRLESSSTQSGFGRLLHGAELYLAWLEERLASLPGAPARPSRPRCRSAWALPQPPSASQRQRPRCLQVSPSRSRLHAPRGPARAPRRLLARGAAARLGRSSTRRRSRRVRFLVSSPSSVLTALAAWYAPSPPPTSRLATPVTLALVPGSTAVALLAFVRVTPEPTASVQAWPPTARPLRRFGAATQRWFERAFSRPARPPPGRAIARGQHVLVPALTGSGKTLAAFLAGLDRLLGEERAPGSWQTGAALPLAAQGPERRRRAQPALAARRHPRDGSRRGRGAARRRGRRSHRADNARRTHADAWRVARPSTC